MMRHWLILIGLCASLLLTLAGTAGAQTTPRLDGSGFIPYFSENERPYVCMHESPGFGITEKNWNEKFSARIMYCMRTLLQEGTEQIMQAVIEFMTPIMAAAMLLSITLFGTRLVGGQFQSLKAELMLFVFRISVTLFVFLNSAAVVGFGYELIETLMNWVADGAGLAFKSVSATLPDDMRICDAFPPSDLSPWYLVFDRIDCIFGKLFGFGKDTAVNVALFAILGSAIFAGTLGVAIAMTGIVLFVTVILFVARSVLSVIMAFCTISLMMMMLPVFLPAALFQRTESYVLERWVGTFTQVVIQPALLVGFLFFSATLIDSIMFGGTTDYYTGRGVEGLSTMQYLGPGQQPDDGRYPVVSPLFKTTGINPADSLEDQQESLKRIIKFEKLWTWKLEGEVLYSLFFKNYCGRGGEIYLSEGDITSTQLEATAQVSRPVLQQNVRMWDKFIASIRRANNAIETAVNKQLNNLQKALEDGTRSIVCQGGRAITSGKAAEAVMTPVNQMLDILTPTVIKLDLSNVEELPNLVRSGSETVTSFPVQDTHAINPAADDDSSVSPSTLNAERFRRLLTSILALIVVVGVCINFISVIPQMASFITQRGGLSMMPNVPRQVNSFIEQTGAMASFAVSGTLGSTNPKAMAPRGWLLGGSRGGRLGPRESVRATVSGLAGGFSYATYSHTIGRALRSRPKTTPRK